MSKEMRPFIPLTPEESKIILKDAMKCAANAVVWTKDQKHVLKTHISAVSEAVGHFFVWVPKDIDAQKFTKDVLIERTSTCYFSLSLKHATIFFRSQLIGLEAVGFKFEIPEKLFKVQRRKNFRFPVPDGIVIYVEFQDPLFPDQKMKKKVADLSAGGLSFFVNSLESPMFQQDQDLEKIEFTIRGHKIKTEGLVRYRENPDSEPESKNQSRIGIKFKGLSAGDTDQIASYVMEESRKHFSKLH